MMFNDLVHTGIANFPLLSLKPFYKKFSIGIDMDGVITSFNLSVYDKLISEFPDISLEDIGLNPSLTPHIEKLIRQKGFFYNLDPLINAIETIMKLKDLEHEILIITKPTYSPYCAQEKIDWIQYWIPELLNNLIITKRKDTIVCDIMIEDMEKNLETSLAQYKVIMDYPYNKNYKADFRSHSGYESDKAWDSIFNYIKNISGMNN